MEIFILEKTRETRIAKHLRHLWLLLLLKEFINETLINFDLLTRLEWIVTLCHLDAVSLLLKTIRNLLLSVFFVCKGISYGH